MLFYGILLYAKAFGSSYIILLAFLNHIKTHKHWYDWDGFSMQCWITAFLICS